MEELKLLKIASPREFNVNFFYVSGLGFRV